jgi:hypothetical protein
VGQCISFKEVYGQGPSKKEGLKPSVTHSAYYYYYFEKELLSQTFQKE